MQTTIQLDDAVHARAAKLASANGCDLSHFIEEALREKIAHTPQNPQPFPRSFEGLTLTTAGGSGLRAGVNLDNSAALFDLMDQQA